MRKAIGWLIGIFLLLALMPGGGSYAATNGIVPVRQNDKLTPGDEVIALRTATSKTVYLGGDRYGLTAYMTPINYQDTAGAWQIIEPDIIPSDLPNWDFEVTKGLYEIRIKNDTTVALLKDGNWIGFQYSGFAYYDTVSKNYIILDNRKTVTPIVIGNKIRWDNIFYGANLIYTYNNGRFKEELEITQTARDWLAANPPSSYGLSNQNTYLTGYLEVDTSLSYDIEGEDGRPLTFDNLELEGEALLWRHPVTQKIVQALPIGYAWHIDDVLGEQRVVIRSRFWKQNDTNYLLYGARVSSLNQMPAGTIIIDPTVDVQIDNTANDGRRYTGSSGFSTTDSSQFMGYFNNSSFYNCNYFARWTGVTISGTIDTSYVSIYGRDFPSGTPQMKVYVIDEDNPAAPTSAAEFDADALTSGIDWDGAIAKNTWVNSPSLNTIFQELVDSFTIDSDAVMVQIKNDGGAVNRYNYPADYSFSSSFGAKLHIEYTVGGASAPTVVTVGSSNIEATTATASGNVTATGGANVTARTIQYGTSPGVYTANQTEFGDWATGNYSLGLTGLSEGTTLYYRAGANNTAGWGYGSELSFLTKPAAPTNVSATDGSSTENVSITWTASTGATDYQVYQDATPLGWAGNVTSYVDTTAGAPTITPGTATASNGTSSLHVTLSIAGEGGNNGATHTYKVRAKNTTGESADSSTDNGYRGTTSLTYQWLRSAADSDASYSNISGGTTDPYNDIAGVATPDGRYYFASVNMTGAATANTTHDRGYKSATVVAPTLTTSNATSILSSRATLGGNVTATGGGNYETQIIEWGTASGNYTDSDNRTASYGVGPFTFDVTGLSDNTTYYFRARAINDGNTGNGTEKSFTTLVSGLEAPANFTVWDLGGVMVGANWTVTGNATGFVMKVNRDAFPDSANATWETAYSGNATTANLTGYDVLFHNYKYSLFATDGGAYSDTYATANVGTSVNMSAYILGVDMETLAGSVDNATAVMVSLGNSIITIGNSALEIGGQTLILLVLIIVVVVIAHWKKLPGDYYIAGVLCILFALTELVFIGWGAALFICFGVYMFWKAKYAKEI